MYRIILPDYNAELDLNDKVKISLNYQQTDFTNPQAIKTSYSKSVTIIGTQNNNNIFNHIYQIGSNRIPNRIDRTKKTNYILLYDDVEVGRGYFILNGYKKTVNDIIYTITLYDIIGQTLLSLKTDDEGNELTLADLTYFEGDDLEEYDFDSNYVLDCWWNYTTYGIWDKNDPNFKSLIYPVPSYKGFYDDFDSNKIALNYQRTKYPYGVLPSVDADKTYTTHNGWTICELDREINEWEANQLFANKQKLGINAGAVFRACWNKLRNGKYKELDDFFDKDILNLLDKSSIILPDMDKEKKVEEKKDDTVGELLTNPSYYWENSIRYDQPFYNKSSFRGQQNIDESTNFITFTFEPMLIVEGNTIYDKVLFSWGNLVSSKPTENWRTYPAYVTIPLIIYSVELANKHTDEIEAVYYTVVSSDSTQNLHINEYYNEYLTRIEQLIRQEDKYMRGKEIEINVDVSKYTKHKFNFVTESSDSSTANKIQFEKVNMTVPINSEQYYIINSISTTYSHFVPTYSGYSPLEPAVFRGHQDDIITYWEVKSNSPLNRTDSQYVWKWEISRYGFMTPKVEIRNDWYVEVTDGVDNFIQSIGITENETYKYCRLETKVSAGKQTQGNPNIVTTKLSKKNLLFGTISPYEIFLSIIKLFNLKLISKDNELLLLTYKQFYNNEIDLTDYIDYKTIEYKPTITEYKYYNYFIPYDENNYAMRINKKGNNITTERKNIMEYFGINTEKIDVLEDIKLKQTIPFRITSNWMYESYIDEMGRLFEPVNKGGQIKQKLYNGNDVYERTFVGMTYYHPKNIATDKNAKISFFDSNNDTIDADYTIAVLDGEAQQNIYVVDEIPEVKLLNEGKSCYYQISTEYSTDKIMYDSTANEPDEQYKSTNDVYYSRRIYHIPNYTNIGLLFNNQTSPNIGGGTSSVNVWNYHEWEFNNLYHRDNCQLKVRFRLPEPIIKATKLLRSVFFFEGGYWILNKLIDFDYNNDYQTGEFVKINSIEVSKQKNL